MDSQVVQANGKSPTTTVVAGQWFLADSTAARPVQISREGLELVVRTQYGAEARYDFNVVQLSAAVHGVPLRIILPDGSELSVPAGSDTAMLTKGKWLLQGPQTFRNWLLLLLAGLAAVVILFKVVIPAIGEVIVPRLSTTTINSIGAHFFASYQDLFVFESFNPAHLEARAQLTELGERLTSITVDDFDYAFYLDTSDDWGPNAFAFPNGHIIMTYPLYEVLESDEVLAILAHEVAHVTQRHSMVQLIQESVWYVLSLTTFGPAGLSAVPELAQLANSRAAEQSADCIGVEYLQAVGAPPTAMADGLRKIKEEFESVPQDQDEAVESLEFTLPDILKTHPGITERISAAEQCAAALPGLDN